MAGRYFGIPFATAGDKVVVPDATQPDGSVSFTQGFGFDYERPNTDPSYKPVPRDGTNGLFHDITEALGIAQRQGVSDWTVDAQPYNINAIVRHNDIVWRSLVINNNVTPVEGASWTQVGVDASETVKGLVELATPAEAQALTDAVRVLTPKTLADAFKGGNQSLVANGFSKNPGGFILQWGIDDTGGATSKTVTFPIAFPAACRGAIVMDIENAPAAIRIGGVAGFSTTNFVATFNANPSSFFWFALGH